MRPQKKRLEPSANGGFGRDNAQAVDKSVVRLDTNLAPRHALAEAEDGLARLFERRRRRIVDRLDEGFGAGRRGLQMLIRGESDHGAHSAPAR
jgi:hypothetical protein